MRRFNDLAVDIRWQQRFVNYTKALEQLERFFEPPALNEREQQGLIKAFEYTLELAWNTLRDLLRGQGNESLLGSRDTFGVACGRRRFDSRGACGGISCAGLSRTGP